MSTRSPWLWAVTSVVLAAGCSSSTTNGATVDGEAAADRALDALLQQFDSHDHDGSEGPDHDHGFADDAASDGDHVHAGDAAAGGDGAHVGPHDYGPPQGACAEPTISTMHPLCQGNEGCTVHVIAPCECGCARCWYDECVELACDVTPGCDDTP